VFSLSSLCWGVPLCFVICDLPHLIKVQAGKNVVLLKKEKKRKEDTGSTSILAWYRRNILTWYKHWIHTSSAENMIDVNILCRWQSCIPDSIYGTDHKKADSVASSLSLKQPVARCAANYFNRVNHTYINQIFLPTLLLDLWRCYTCASRLYANSHIPACVLATLETRLHESRYYPMWVSREHWSLPDIIKPAVQHHDPFQYSTKTSMRRWCIAAIQIHKKIIRNFSMPSGPYNKDKV